ncbi:MAG: hypothetical protein ACFWUD_04575 [Thermocaproicibacter melissae]|jgi:hypothetical protein|uniref:hypothetical protein n=1 Tax=Thermocaproicibacter melissae TaxID=2966552 RepID=UPI0024B2324E|nr:hypothetical protein [Thermocaproicibacter melissae]WBY64346.1 hypothetical protein NOG13_01125 [Thermocaproicibacter melissae]
MPDNLRITTPVNTLNEIARPNQAVEANRVPKTGNTTEPNLQSADLLLSGSVFNQFLRQLEQTPGLDQTLMRLLGDAAAAQYASQAGISDFEQNIPEPMKALVSALATDADGMMEEVRAQSKDSTLFTGPLFRFLDQLSAQEADPQFDLHVANFLKAYSGVQNAAGTRAAIHRNLEQLKYTIPLPFAKRLVPLIAELTGDTDADLAVLKQKIIPLLGEYAAKTNEIGKPRDTISMLLNNTAILNESTRANLNAKFNELYVYCRDTLNLPQMTLNMLRAFFAAELSETNDSKKEAFLSKLTSLLSATGKAAEGIDRTVLHDITRSLLLDSSVFMPFVHLVLPAQIDGRFLFAQMWIEKTDPDTAGKGQRRAVTGPKNIYLSFEIQDLGLFEASVSLMGKQVNMKLACPPTFRSFNSEIRNSISSILRRNGLEPEEVRVSSAQSKPQIPDIILQKVKERRRSVDVTV